MKNFSFIVFAIFPLMLQLGCKNSTGIGNDLQIDSTEVNKVVLYKENQPVKSRKEDFLLNLAQVMALPSIHTGENEKIRIWLWGSSTMYVIDLDFHDKKQQAFVQSFNSNFTDSGEVINIHKKWIVDQPVGGWEKLNQLIQANQIFLLSGGKTTKEIKWDIPTHASWVQFEVFHESKYRYFEYFEPGFYRKVDFDSKRVYDFLSYLEKNFSINLYNYPATFFFSPQ